MQTTTYTEAWDAYKRSEEYQRAHRLLISKQLKPDYAENILRGSFDAGWNARKD